MYSWRVPVFRPACFPSTWPYSSFIFYTWVCQMYSPSVQALTILSAQPQTRGVLAVCPTQSDVHDGHQTLTGAQWAQQPVSVGLPQHLKDISLVEAQMAGLCGDVMAQSPHFTVRKPNKNIYSILIQHHFIYQTKNKVLYVISVWLALSTRTMYLHPPANRDFMSLVLNPYNLQQLRAVLHCSPLTDINPLCMSPTYCYWFQLQFLMFCLQKCLTYV